ncbi:MSHA biogenesis protein MshP [Gammaproteobacteria bacterium]
MNPQTSFLRLFPELRQRPSSPPRRSGPQYRRRKEEGFALASAIFLLVVLATLGAFILSVSNIQHLTSAQDIQGSRAYWAAKAGIQWMAAMLNANGACPGTQVISLEGFSISITCTSNAYTEGNNPTVIYWVTSTATSGGGIGGISYTERMVDSFIEF